MGSPDKYGLDPDTDWEQVPECKGPHPWGPWVLSPIYANREDRFCTACGIMEMQWIDDQPVGRVSPDA